VRAHRHADLEAKITVVAGLLSRGAAVATLIDAHSARRYRR